MGDALLLAVNVSSAKRTIGALAADRRCVGVLCVGTPLGLGSRAWPGGGASGHLHDWQMATIDKVGLPAARESPWGEPMDPDHG